VVVPDGDSLGLLSRLGDHGGKRGDITVFTRDSRINLAVVLSNSTPVFDSMVTITGDPCSMADLESQGYAKRALDAILKSLKRKGMTHYCWVREYQKNGSLHFHIFTHGLAVAGGSFDRGLSIEVSQTWAYIAGKLVGYHNAKMARASCRVERLRKPAGCYAAKEASKRVQKSKHGNGMAWWRCGRNTKIEQGQIEEVPISQMAGKNVESSGVVQFVPFTLQFHHPGQIQDRV